MCIELKKGDVVFVENNYISKAGIQAGNRPYLVVSNNVFNKYSPVVTAVPLTTKVCKPSPVHFKIGTNTGIARESIVLCEQIQTISKDDVKNVECTLPARLLAEINRLIAFQLAL